MKGFYDFMMNEINSSHIILEVRYHLCVSSHYWIWDRSRRNYVWL